MPIDLESWIDYDLSDLLKFLLNSLIICDWSLSTISSPEKNDFL